MNAPSPASFAVAHPQGHAHEADLETCLDFVNTESYDDGVPNEHLVTVEDAIAWFAAHGLAHEPSLGAQAAADEAAWLERVRVARARAARGLGRRGGATGSRIRARSTP